MMMRTRHSPIIVLLTGILASLANWALCPPSHAGELEIGVLCSHRALPYEQTVQGFKNYLAEQGIHANFQVLQLEGEEAKAATAVEQVKRNRPRMVLTLGTFATFHAIRALSDIPIIAGLILTADEIQARKNATGVIMDFPLEMQFQWLTRILPKCRDVGVLYNSARNSRKIEEAKKVAQNMGLKLNAQQVGSPSEIPGALEALAKQVDVIWGVPDDLVYTPQTAKHILLFSFRNSIPVVGLSDAWVKAGALYALEWDYSDLGGQCGEIAEAILKGNPLDTIQPRWPRKTMFSINKKTAARMNINIPETLLKGSSTIHE
jgi:putative tryptophan/tyrosine transport system substrate-binding protein